MGVHKTTTSYPNKKTTNKWFGARLWFAMRKWFTIKDNQPFKGTTYSEAAEYVVTTLQTEIEYNGKIVRVAIFSGCLWLIILLCYALANKNWSVLFDLKVYPAPLWAILTGAFSENERLEKRKELNAYLRARLNNEPIGNDEFTETSWDELKKVD